MSIEASEAKTGSVYRRTRISPVEAWRGYSVLVTIPPNELDKVITRLRAGHPTSREVFCLSCLRDGAVLCWRYIRRDRSTLREVTALPQDTTLRRVRPPSWLPKGRVS